MEITGVNDENYQSQLKEESAPDKLPKVELLPSIKEIARELYENRNVLDSLVKVGEFSVGFRGTEGNVAQGAIMLFSPDEQPIGFLNFKKYLGRFQVWKGRGIAFQLAGRQNSPFFQDKYFSKLPDLVNNLVIEMRRDVALAVGFNETDKAKYQGQKLALFMMSLSLEIAKQYGSPIEFIDLSERMEKIYQDMQNTPQSENTELAEGVQIFNRTRLVYPKQPPEILTRR